MKIIIKSGILFLTLVIPVVIYLFLRGFGENEFVVPVFYEHGLPADSVNCQSSPDQHIVNLDPVTTRGKVFAEGNAVQPYLTVIDADMKSTVQLNPASPGIQRILDLASTYPEVRIISLRPLMDKKGGITSVDRSVFPNWEIFRIDDDLLQKFSQCQLILSDFPEYQMNWDNKRWVLIDRYGRIRGYYNAHEYAEIDRLILEMKIIIKEEYK